MRCVKETLPPRDRARWLLITMRLSASSLAGTARTLVAVGTVSEAFMFLTTAAAAPRSGVRGGGARGRRAGGRGGAPGGGAGAAGGVVGEEVVPGPAPGGGVGGVLLVHLLDQPLVGAESRHGGGRGGRPVGARA